MNNIAGHHGVTLKWAAFGPVSAVLVALLTVVSAAHGCRVLPAPAHLCPNAPAFSEIQLLGWGGAQAQPAALKASAAGDQDHADNLALLPASAYRTPLSMSASFQWSPLSEQAAELLATGKSIAKVALLLECNDTTIDRWKQHPEFCDRIKERNRAILDAVRREGLAVREHRIMAKRRRHQGLMAFLRLRAGDPTMGGVTGDATGLMIRKEKVLRLGEGLNERIEEYCFDSKYDAALSRMETEIAIEVGDWKKDVVEIAKVEYSDKAIALADLFSLEELERITARAEDIAKTAPAADQAPETEAEKP